MTPHATALFALAATSQTPTCANTTPNTAALFSVDTTNHAYTIVRSTHSDCNGRYVLYPRGSPKPDLGLDYTYFETPIRSVAVSQTPPITFLELLGQRTAIKVAPTLTTSSCVTKLLEEGDAAAYISASTSDADQMSAHSAQMNDDDVEMIISDPWGTDNWADSASRPKVVCDASTYETTPLGGAEWLKFFAPFFGINAGEAYCAVSSRYSCNSIASSSFTSNAAALGLEAYTYRVPKVLFVSKDWNGDFTINMAPYWNSMLYDAGGDYPNLDAYAALKTTHFTGSHVSGFKFPSAQNATFHAALALADVIIDQSYPFGHTTTSLQTAYGFGPTSTLPNAFLNARVYTIDGTMDSTGASGGGTDWYGSRVAEPDALLADFAAVLHPSASDAQPDLHYLRHLVTGSITSVASSSCADTAAARPVKAPTCSTLADASSGAAAGILSWLGSIGAAAAPVETAPEQPLTPSTIAMIVLAVLVGLLLLSNAVLVVLVLKKNKGGHAEKSIQA